MVMWPHDPLRVSGRVEKERRAQSDVAEACDNEHSTLKDRLWHLCEGALKGADDEGRKMLTVNLVLRFFGFSV
jgi:hypothetical protein